MLMAATPIKTTMRRRGRRSPPPSSSSPPPCGGTATTAATTPSKRCSPRLLLGIADDGGGSGTKRTTTPPRRTSPSSSSPVPPPPHHDEAEESRGPPGEGHGHGHGIEIEVEVEIDGDAGEAALPGGGRLERERERAAPSPTPHSQPAEPDDDDDDDDGGGGVAVTTEISPGGGKGDGNGDGQHALVARSVTIDVDGEGDADGAGGDGGGGSSPPGGAAVVDRRDAGTKSSPDDAEVVETGRVLPPPPSSSSSSSSSGDGAAASAADARLGTIREYPSGSKEGGGGVPRAATVSAASTTPHQGALNGVGADDEELLRPPLSSLSEFSPLSFEEGMQGMVVVDDVADTGVPVPRASSSSPCGSALRCRGGARGGGGGGGSQGSRGSKRGRHSREARSTQEEVGGGRLEERRDVVTPVQLTIASPVEVEVAVSGRKRRRLDGAAASTVDDPGAGSDDRRPATTGAAVPAPAPGADVPQAFEPSGRGIMDASNAASTVDRAVPEGRGRGRGPAIVGRGGRSRRAGDDGGAAGGRRARGDRGNSGAGPAPPLPPRRSSTTCDRASVVVSTTKGGGRSDSLRRDPVPERNGGGGAEPFGITRSRPRRGASRSGAVAANGATRTLRKEEAAKSSQRTVPPCSLGDDGADSTAASSRSKRAGEGKRNDGEEQTPPAPSTGRPPSSSSRRVVHVDTTWAQSTALSQGAELNAVQAILIELLRKVRRKCDRYGFFSRPVDPIGDGCPDYYDAVDRHTEAMDLGTMETMIRDGRIGDVHDFENLLGRIVRCALRYNTDGDNFVRLQALELERAAPPMVERSRRAVERLCQLRAGAGPGAATVAAPPAAAPPPPPPPPAPAVVSGTASSSSSYAGVVFDVAAVEAAAAAAAPTSDEAAHADVTHEETSGNDDATKTDVPRTDRTPRGRDDDATRCAATAHDAFDASIPGSHIPRCRRDLDTSIVTPCTARDDWLALCPEMLLVTNEAARRSTLSADPDADRYDKPLSETYMRERLDCHLPLEGYFVRADPSKQGGGGRGRGRKKKSSPLGRPHLQGFIVTSTFITWRRTFRWDLDAPQAGITPADRRVGACDDGTLTSDLRGQERRHDADNNCFVFPRLAEITLLGGLGCGGALVRRAMGDLERSGRYDLVVLQATKMAIPFYEKLGFVRVGAVARFYDSEELPEVAYRHWSETTGKQAIEASYMMAARLNSPGGDGATIHATSPDESSRTKMTNTKDDVDLSRRHALELIRACLPIHTGKAGGSFSYRELAGMAKRLASSVGDDDLVDLIGRSLDVYRSNAPGNSKTILRGALDMPIFCHHIAETTVSEPKKTPAHKLSTGSRPVRGGKLIRISRILVDGEPISSGSDNRRDEDGDCLHAFVPVKARRPRRSTIPNGGRPTGSNCVTVSVVVLGSSTHSLGLCEADAVLTAVIDRSDDDHGSESDHDNDKAMKEASWASLKNLRGAMEAMVHGVEPGVGPIAVAVGDKVMVQVEMDDKEDPSWQMAKVVRRCKKYEIPEGGNADNSYVVRSSGGPKFGFAFVLDGCGGGGGMDRGIGRKWCTICDWTGFPNLDHNVLDSLLIGASVHYVSTEGDRVVGVVSQRVRDSRGTCSKWRVERRTVSGGVVSKGSSCFVDLDPAELRECVRISDETMRRVANMVLSRDSFPQQKEKAAGVGSRKRKRSTISEEEGGERKYRGVYRAGSRWCAKLSHDGRLLHLGTFDSQLAASEAFREAFKRIKGCSPE